MQASYIQAPLGSRELTSLVCPGNYGVTLPVCPPHLHDDGPGNRNYGDVPALSDAPSLADIHRSDARATTAYGDESGATVNVN